MAIVGQLTVNTTTSEALAADEYREGVVLCLEAGEETVYGTFVA